MEAGGIIEQCLVWGEVEQSLAQSVEGVSHREKGRIAVAIQELEMVAHSLPQDAPDFGL